MRVAAALLLLCGLAPLAGAPVERGRAVYVARCADCHGRGFEGVEDAPPLTGTRFEAKWRGRPEALYAKIKLSMPQDDPGVLTPAQAEDVTALILAANRMPVAPARH